MVILRQFDNPCRWASQHSSVNCSIYTRNAKDAMINRVYRSTAIHPATIYGLITAGKISSVNRHTTSVRKWGQLKDIKCGKSRPTSTIKQNFLLLPRTENHQHFFSGGLLIADWLVNAKDFIHQLIFHGHIVHIILIVIATLKNCRFWTLRPALISLFHFLRLKDHYPSVHSAHSASFPTASQH